ncbi:autotransporter domain-containing protein [Bradyrhizobium sp. INPA03-11B]|uniref:autotransporter domain-containing protein n=1 Tax=Bradyrhizobium sp. INPA03-11B TaxID=418598 RepID=UPI00338E14A4
MLNASDGASLVTALTTIDNNPGTSFTLNITQNITLTSGTTLPIINSSSTVTINGGNFTLDGGGVQRGLFVYSGTVAVNNLTIQNAVAKGGNGGSGLDGGGGGGMGAGGALFVASGANVTVSNVSLASNRAIGGNGGNYGAGGGGGGGGGLGGNGGNGGNNGAGGGGGIGVGADGGAGAASTAGGNGAAGIAVGAAGGGAGITDSFSGATAGTGGASGGGGGGGALGAGSNSSGGGGGIGGGAATPTSGLSGGGGVGGFGGGGGGSLNTSGGDGGFGGGGGSVRCYLSAGKGGFGGGGGGSSGNDGGSCGNIGGFGAGNGGNDSQGGAGGGLGAGGAVFVQGGGTLTVAGAFTVNGSSVSGGTGGVGAGNGSAFGAGMFLQGNGTLTFNPAAGQNQTVSDVIADQTGSGGTGATAGSWGLAKTGAGTLTLTAANTYSGGTTVSGGLMNFNAASNFGSGNITLNGGGLQWASGNTADISGKLNAIGSGGTTFDYNGNAVTLATALAGTGGVTVANSGSGGALTLTTAENYSGATTINSGATLALSTFGSISNSSVVTVNGTFDISASLPLPNRITTLAGDGSVVLGSNILVITAGSTEFSGTINGSVPTDGLEIAGGKQTLSGVNGYLGITQIDSGATLALKGNGSIVNSFAVAFAPGAGIGTFDISQTNNGASVRGLSDPTGHSVVSLGAKTLTITSVVGRYNGVIQDGGIGGGTGGNVAVAYGALAIFGGVNTYTGLTTINGGGELDLISGGSIASSKAVINDGMFDISRAGGDVSINSLSGTSIFGAVNLGANTLTFTNANGTFAGTIRDGGAGGGVAITGGKEILTGINTYTGATTVTGGTLEVDGSIASSSKVTVNSGGTLSGTGTVGSGLVFTGGFHGTSDGNLGGVLISGGSNFVALRPIVGASAPTRGFVIPAPTTIMSGGTLAPGSAADPTGTLTIGGSLAFQSGAIYQVHVTPTAASSTSINANATLGGATVNAVFANGSYISRQYTILTAAGGISGTFASNIANTNLPQNFSDTLSYDATHAYLNLTLGFAPPPNFGAGLSINQQNVANTLVNYFNTTGGIQTAFGTLAPADLTQASGELATGSQQTTFDAMNLFMGLLTDPFMNRGGGAGPMPGAPGYAEEGEASAYAATKKTDAFAMFTKAPPVPFVQRWNVWAAGFGGSQSTSGNAIVGSNNTTSSVYGTAVGADYLFSPNTIAGFAIAGGGTNFSVLGSGSGRSDLFQAGGYLRHSEGPAYLSAALAYGWQDITTNRTVSAAGIDQLRAEFNANAWSGRLEGGYRFVAPWIGGVGITLYAAGQFTSFELPAYAERVISGLPNFALSYAGRSVTDPRSELGLRTDKSFPVQDGILTLRTRFAWAHDYNPNRLAAATFQALPGTSFVVNGAAQASDSALTTASLEMNWRNGWSASATFEGEFSNVTSSYAGKGVVRYQW